MVAAQLRRSVAERRPAPAAPGDLLNDLPAQTLRRLVRFAEADREIHATDVDAETWSILDCSNLTMLRIRGQRLLVGTAREWLIELGRRKPLLGTRLLWVDDRPDSNSYLAKRFIGEGAEVVEVPTTQAALSRINEGFELIISDMVRKEGEREGLILLEALRNGGSAIPVLVFAGRYASLAHNREEAIRAGALLCTNNGEELYAEARNLLLMSELPSQVGASQLTRTELGENHAVILTGDRAGTHVHQRSAEALVIMLENCLRVPAGNVLRFSIDEWLSEHSRDDWLRIAADGKKEGTLFIYAAAPAVMSLPEAHVKGKAVLPFVPPIDWVAGQVRDGGRFEQVVLIVDSEEGVMPAVFGAEGSAMPQGSVKPGSLPRPTLYSVVANGGSRSRGNPDAGILPVTRALIVSVETLAPSGRLEGNQLSREIRQRMPLCRIEEEGEFAYRQIDLGSAPAIRTWDAYRAEGVEWANRREHAADVLALKAYERALELRPDVPNRDKHAQLLVYRAAMLKRLGRLDKALDALVESESIWSETTAESDAWYNLAAVYALLGDRPLMLDALHAIRHDPRARNSVESHLGDYFIRFSNDPGLHAFLSGEQAGFRDPRNIAQGDFYTAQEIVAIAAEVAGLARNERPRNSLAILSTDSQRTWLVVTSRSLIFLLDEIRTRQRRQLHQQTLPLASVHSIEAKVKANGETVVGFASREARTSWYYSPQTFPAPADVEAAIAALLASARAERPA